MNEMTVEQAVLDWAQAMGYATVPGAELTPESPVRERADWATPFLLGRLQAAVARINPRVPADALAEAVRKVTTPESPSLIENNRRLHRMLVEGIDVEYRAPDGTIRGDKVWLIDFARPDRNEFLAANQFVVIEDHHNRRADVVIFINGLPLIVFELKSATQPGAAVKNAYNQLQTYKAEIAGLFVYNAFCIASDGLEARVGTLTADWDRYMPWRTVDGAALAPRGTLELETLVKGMLDRSRLLDLVRHFIVFEEDDDSGAVVKKMAGYHQYHAVNKAVDCTVKAAAPGGDRRVGVVWHTQGSGKSLSMVFYAGKIVAHPAMANPTIVVLTDRNDLDDQLFGTFGGCRDLLRQTPVQAETREHLRELLRVASGGVVFTTIQKFLPETLGERLPALTDRRNVVVIADEAHRSQYGFRARVVKSEDEAVLAYGLAQHVRDALPHASFLGFTGTPIESTDRSTPAVFGDYIDVYDIQRAVEDRATVPILYEARLAKLQLKEEERPRLDPEFEEITEGEEIEQKERLKTKWAALEALVGSPTRLEQIARDLITHFEERQAVMEGKGMIVCMSRRICVDLYKKIVELRPEWHSDDPAKGAVKVVMTGAADDPEAYRPHVRNKRQSRDLAKRFKKTGDELKLVIVRDMWLTGFDVPCLHTMYLDKPMGGHNLMQAIARVNRVFKDKPGGLVVDYLGLADQLKKALRDYTESGGEGQPTFDQERAVELLVTKYEQCCAIFHGFDWSKWKTGTPAERLGLLPAAQEHILTLADGKKRYLQITSELNQAFALSAGHDRALALREDVAFFQSVRAALTKTTIEGQKAVENLDSAIRQLVSRAIASDGVIDIFSAAGLRNPDISILSDEFLAEVQALPLRNLALELLKKLINGEIKVRERRNVVQARKFSELLEKSVRQYQNRAIEAAQVIEQLIAMARDLRDSDHRGEDMGLSVEEVAFYDALAENESAVQVMGDAQLKIIAHELVDVVRHNVTIDWTVKESVRANLRRLVRRILRKYGYPPDLQEQATKTVLEQAEVLCAEVAA